MNYASLKEHRIMQIAYSTTLSAVIANEFASISKEESLHCVVVAERALFNLRYPNSSMPSPRDVVFPNDKLNKHLESTFTIFCTDFMPFRVSDVSHIFFKIDNENKKMRTSFLASKNMLV